METYGDYLMQNLTESQQDVTKIVSTSGGRSLLGLLPMFLLILLIVLKITWGLYQSLGQKTRNPQQRRMYVGTQRQSLGAMGQEPTIYVSPSNLPPPPKYECMAPPSYEEVVGVHYPQFNAQPISQPISAALAQSEPISVQNQIGQPISGPSQPENVTAVTVVSEARRTSVTVART